MFRWTFADGRKAYLAEVARIRRPATADDYRNMLRHPALAGLETRPLPTISRQDLAGIVAGIHRAGTESTAEHLVRVLRPMWRWLADDGQRDRSGVQPGLLDGLRAPERTIDEADDGVYVPDLDELGRIVAIARSGALDAIVGSAVELLVFSVQRRRTVASARVQDFEATGDLGGLWHIPPASRKSGRQRPRPHTVPLPPPAWACVQRALAARDGDGPWLFPATRPRRTGGEIGHIHPSTLTHAMGLMPGVKASPHAIRRAFATHGESKLGLLRADTRSILDHSEGGEASDVTSRHYALHDGTHRKWPIVRTWASALEPEIKSAVAGLEGVEDLKAAIAAARNGS